MNKFVKLISALYLLLKKPALLNLILKEDGVYKLKFERKHKQIKLQELSVLDWPEAHEVKIAPYAFLSGSSLPTDFALLQLLCRKFKVATYFEIGTWRGESAANVAPFVKQVYTLNLPDETLKEMGQSNAYIQSHRFFSKHLSNVTHLFGDSATFDWQPFARQMDLIFIDGDHSTEAVERDTRNTLQLQKNQDSIIVWHDAKSDTEYPRYEVLLGIYNGLPKSMHQHVYLVKNSLCAVYLPQHPKGEPIEINALPTKSFELTIKQVNTVS
ncbi:MAG: class I SAM-dependent methyltransferase [Sphingomonadales bacterium]